MYDEDNYEETSENGISCLYCQSTGECPHQLASIDRSFCSCDGGYAFERYSEYSEAVETHFKRLLIAGEVNCVWGDYKLNNLWKYARETYKEGDEHINIDGDILTEMNIALLERAGGDNHPGSIVDDNGPGYTSSMELFYALDPKKIFENSLSILKDRLNDVKVKKVAP